MAHYERLVMSRRGWQASLVRFAILVPLALGVSCGGNDRTDDLFQESGSPSAGGFDSNGVGRSGSGGGGRTGASGGGGAKALPPAAGGSANGGKSASGGSEATGGRSGVNGGRTGGGGRSGPSGGRPPAGGAASGGKASGGKASGGAPDNAGSAGEPAVDCNDDDACTVDERSGDDCSHESKECDAPPVCQVAECDPETGECLLSAAPDETACDDEDACTSNDACREGQCLGSDALDTSDSSSRPIPDGPADCSGSDALLVDYGMTGPGEVSEVEVTVSITHPWITDLRVGLLHVETETFVTLIEEEVHQDASLDGEYVFADDAPSFVEAVPEDAPVPSGRYAPRSSLLEAFAGLPFEGTWRVVVLDQCEGDAGVLHASAVHFHRVCGDG